MATTPDHLTSGDQPASSWLSQSPLNGAPLSPTTMFLLLLSLFGSLLFTITYLIEGITRPGYDALREPVSALSLGSGGWVQQANFIIFGLIGLCTVPATRSVLRGGLGVTWYPIFRAISGLSFIMLGIFSQDPAYGYPPGAVVLTIPTTSGMIHIIFSFVSFLASATGCFIIARRFAREPRWRGWATYTVLTGVLMIVFVAVYGTLNAQHSPIAGVFERLSGGIDSLWGVILIARLFIIQREANASMRPQRV